jgi:alginate O-acetyltransferase complex protein AlgI
LYHGAFLVLERTWFGKALERLFAPVRLIYTIGVVVVGWVLVRADSFHDAAVFLGNMAGIQRGPILWHPLRLYLTHQVAWMIVAGGVFSMPTWPWLRQWATRKLDALPEALRTPAHAAMAIGGVGLYAGLLLICAVWLAGGTYNPFIYFRF